MSDRREYLCVDCGLTMFAARGEMADLDIECVCRNRSCRRFNVFRLSTPQTISEAQRERWRRRRERQHASLSSSLPA